MKIDKLLATRSVKPNPEVDPSVIARSAEFGKGVQLRKVDFIGAYVKIGAGSEVYRGVYIDRNVKVGPKSFIGRNAVLLSGATLGKEVEVYNDAVVGPGVELADFAWVGSEQIVPATGAIAVLNNLGLRNRNMTVLGSEQGPLINIAYETNLSLNNFKQRVDKRIDTTERSAALYQQRYEEIDETAARVQSVFEDSSDILEEMKQLVADIRDAS